MSGIGEVTETKPGCKGPKAGLVQIDHAPQYWKSPEELRSGSRFSGEFPGGLKLEASRRDFLAMMGFTLAAVGTNGCRAPVQNAIPLVVGSDDIIPGVANYYATTCRGCSASCSLLVKQRDGRPIKIEGNDESELFGGGTCATGQATVLSLYDAERLRGPMWQGNPATWQEVDRHILDALTASRATDRKVVLLSGSITSPSTKQLITEWDSSYPHFQHVVYEPFSFSAMRQANAQSFGAAAIPHYRFDKARVILGLDADFLGTWLSPVEFARQYAEGRKSDSKRSLHIQFESGLSVTGSNADLRVPVAPSEIGLAALALLRRVAVKSGVEGVPRGPEPFATPDQLDLIAEELWKHRGESLVVTGTNDVSVQVLVNALNNLLGSIGKTVDLEQASFQQSGDDAAMRELLGDLRAGKVHTLLMHGVNPAYDWEDQEGFLSALQKVDLSVSFSDRRDETSSHVHAICPDHHFLESWGDAEPITAHYSLAQPLIAPLFDTRSAQDSLLKWVGNLDSNPYSYIRDFWREQLFPRQKQFADFELFWEKSLRDGVAVLPPSNATPQQGFHGDWLESANTVLREHRQIQDPQNQDRYELHFYQTVALRDGRHANNPWLQELPDPISKVTWGNYAAVALNTADKLGVKEGDVIRIKTERGQIELPVFIQPGQEAKTISIALGYGRTVVGKVGQNIGANVYPLTAIVGSSRRYSATQAIIDKTGRHETVASTQSHFSMEGRPIVLETTLDELHKGEITPKDEEALPTLWAERPSGEHSWGMAIDLDACIGCSACVVACQAENNVPVIGKEEITRTRIMHWIRIDRYYSGAAENPESLHQPMMCQHCQNAPCETVCPVLATTTSSEGLNQQIYNRCIGTRYCANNCPYKVRRFNWFNYTNNPEYDFNMANPVGRLVLNPDVVVRSRGVMEKCTLCVQRIQLAKNSALQGKRELRDGDIQTACQQACPTQAIVFGDLKDSGSRLSKLHANQRYYQALGELGIRPNVGYMKKIRNPTQTA